MKKLCLFTLAVLFYFAGCNTEEPVKFESSEGEQLLKNFPDRILLPEGFNPEGIATGRGSTFYVGSLLTGEIFKGDYKTGEGSVFVSSSDRLAYGLSYDSRSNYLFVAGGTSGALYIYDGTSGSLVAEYEIPGSVILNDVLVTRDAAYLTESVDSVIYKLPLGPRGLPVSGIEEITLSGDYDFIENAPTPFGINNNGIEADPAGKYLIIGNMADGSLYRVNPETGFADLIDLGGDSLNFSDGLVLHNHTLYVVQNIISQVSVVNLSSDFLSGSIESVITSPFLEVPATGALFGNSLYVVNARFTLPPGPFYVVRLLR